MPRFNPHPAHVGGVTKVGVGHVAAFSFQSAPRPRGRGDFSRLPKCQQVIRFNPHPAHVGGVTQDVRGVVHSFCRFNPHPAHVGGVTQIVPALTFSCTAFQSAPRPRGRGDLARPSRPRASGCFNPHPAHVGGVTKLSARYSARLAGFNPHPAHVGGVTRQKKQVPAY